MPKVTVLITDDSVTMRALIKSVLLRDKDIEVIGEAGDPYEAREKIKELNPDVLLLDIEMPKMSGIAFLEKVMTLRPMPVVMLAGSTKRGAKDTIEALSLGAFECIEKPKSGDYVAGLSGLASILKAAARHSTPKASQKTSAPSKPSISNYSPNKSVIGIGSSTGGVEALLQVLSAFPKNCPPTIITQHMPKTFLVSFADRLNRTIAPEVQIAKDGELMKLGNVYLAPGGETHLEIGGRTQFRCLLKASDPVSGHRPSVDVMFSSMAKAAKHRSIGVILTGLGRDGARGLLEMRGAGARTVGQDEDSCIVYGMPKVAYNIGAVENQVALDKIGQLILEMSCENHASNVAR